MALMRVTCPESAHLETIQYADHPLGMLILRCTAFSGECEPDCPRTCARRLDQKQRDQKRLADGTVLLATSCLYRSRTRR